MKAGAMADPAANHEIKQGDRFIKDPEVREITSVPTSTRFRLMRANKFPKSVPLPGGRCAWLESEVRAWMRERIALREATTN